MFYIKCYIDNRLSLKALCDDNMGLQFEGAIDNISEPQLAFIRDVLEKRGYKDTKVTFEAVGQAGDNYVANVKRIVVRNENGVFQMIAKIAPQHEFLRNAVETDQVFKNELIMYKLVLPKFQQLEEQADLLKEDRLRFAECYGASMTAPHEVILLEDMNEPGFIMLDRFKPLSDECIRSVLRNLALLHSLSYALKHKELDVFNEYKNSLFDMWGNLMDKPLTKTHFDSMQNTFMKIVDGDHRKRIIKDSIIQGITLGIKFAKQDEGSKYSIIQQGDSWINNILFRFDGDSLQESVLIDYQMSKESNPSCDILYMLLTCTDHESRLKHYHDWIDFYHSELDKALANHGLKSNYVYPRDKLDADLKRYAKVMFGLAVIVAHSLAKKNEDAAKMKEIMKEEVDADSLNELLQIDDETTQILKRRLEGLVDSLLKFGLL
ncbi:hypothetical protein O3G_MSEX009914 [Manduca sexta]|uniref:CHK kinase-like domain-containing protein n=1 Tax=Manduca sexta TaxID=7130 RepID=A0A921ZFR9_MANSE|nr:hypothetical protein O3G_MSEX009914 [Manduca sexta]